MLSAAGKPIFESISCANSTNRDAFEDDTEQDESTISSICALVQATMVNVQGYIYGGSTEISVDDSECNNDNAIAVLRSNDSIIYAMVQGPLIFVAVQYYAKHIFIENDDGDRVSETSSSSSRRCCCHTEAYMRLILEYLYAQILFTLTDQVRSILEESANFDVRSMLGPDTEALMHGIIHQARDSGDCATLLTSSVQVVALEPSVRDKTYSILRENIQGALYALLLLENRIVCFIQPKRLDLQLKSCDLHLILNFVKHQAVALSKTESWLPMCLPRFNASGNLFAYSNYLHPESKISILLLSAQNDTSQFNLFHNNFEIIRERFQLNDVECSSPILSDVKRSSKEAHESRMKGYCLVGNVNHFMYRRDISIPSSLSSCGGKFTQSLSFSLGGKSDEPLQQRGWIMYEKLALRLRYVEHNIFLKGSDCFSAQILFESIPVDDDLVSYIEDNAELYMGIRGSDYELFATFNGSISPIDAESHCRQLVERLIDDEDTLFITKNCIWNT